MTQFAELNLALNYGHLRQGGQAVIPDVSQKNLRFRAIHDSFNLFHGDN